MLCFQSSTSFTSSWDPPAWEQCNHFKYSANIWAISLARDSQLHWDCLFTMRKTKQSNCLPALIMETENILSWKGSTRITASNSSWRYSPFPPTEGSFACTAALAEQSFKCKHTIQIRESNWNLGKVLTFAMGYHLCSFSFVSRTFCFAQMSKDFKLQSFLVSCLQSSSIPQQKRGHFVGRNRAWSRRTWKVRPNSWTKLYVLSAQRLLHTI